MNIIEYVAKNGIYDFSERAFCEVDSLVISQLSYLKLDRIVACPEERRAGIVLSSIRDNEKYDSIYRDERYREINTLFFEALSNSKRFGSLILNNFVDVIDTTIDVQFCAMTVEDRKGFKYVVFRGTDDSVVGWKEDLNMTFKTPVPAQRYSVEYLNKVAELFEGDFYVGGHSKGGNLAVYSSMYCRREVADRIINIYSHDGPGFRMELLNKEGFERIGGKIKKYVPKAAVVGLFGNVEKFEVVDCEKHGVKQHNPYNWIVEDFSFKKTEHIGKYSALKADAISIWASSMTEENWALLSDQIFGVFEEAGVDNLNDFNDDFRGTIARVRTAADNMDDDAKEKIKDMLSMFVDTATSVAKEDAKENVILAEQNLKKVKFRKDRASKKENI
ncbi:MAG: DUF2974 domain-containing protein [Lachnospiraceae bacterium]|nr:DUF2974 domain-containing protein [Lachnospiraceae bacterium]